MMKRAVFLVLLFGKNNAFTSQFNPGRRSIKLHSTIDSGNQVVDELLESIDSPEKNETIITQLIQQLEENESTNDESSSRFDRLLGLYDVKFTKTQRPGDNPVGGKWTRKKGFVQKILKTRRTFQHLLPANDTGCGKRSLFFANRTETVVAEAVNVVSLDALRGLIRITVILRGDAVPLLERNNSELFRPLSPLAVRACFDAPRIIFGKKGRIFNMNIGPRTNVLLDTTYCDDRVRIGMGGTSGTRFVFSKCSSNEEANEFRQLLATRPLSKTKALASLGTTVGVGLYYAFVAKRMRFLSGFVSTFATLLGLLVAFSTGGIERDRVPRGGFSKA